MQNFEVEFYEKEDGSKPVNEFLASLDKKMHARIKYKKDFIERYENGKV